MNKSTTNAINQTESIVHDENSAEYQRGITHLHKQLGPMAEQYIDNIKKLLQSLLGSTFPFEELYPRNIIDLKTRELCTVAPH